MDRGNNGWLADLVTKRATVMTSMLIINTICGVICVTVFFKSGDYYLFIGWAPIILYTLYRHEKWAKDAPYLLAPQKVALRGLELYGTSDKALEVESIINEKPVDNPQLKQLGKPKKRAKK